MAHQVSCPLSIANANDLPLGKSMTNVWLPPSVLPDQEAVPLPLGKSILTAGSAKASRPDALRSNRLILDILRIIAIVMKGWSACVGGGGG